LWVSGKKPVRVSEGFEFERIATGIGNKKRTLFAGLATETYGGANHEGQALLTQPFGQSLPALPGQYGAEMGDRDLFVVHRIVCGFRHAVDPVEGELVAKKIEVDPVLGATPLSASQHLTVKSATSFQVGHTEGKVKGYGWHGVGPGMMSGWESVAQNHACLAAGKKKALGVIRLAHCRANRPLG